MSTTKYTPGPWHTNTGMSFYVFGPGHLVEQAGVKDGPFVCSASTQANARLIAAAPDLLDALIRIRVGLIAPVNDHDSLAELCDVAQIAIEKATDL